MALETTLLNRLYQGKKQAIDALLAGSNDLSGISNSITSLYTALNLPEPKRYFAADPLDARRLCNHLRGRRLDPSITYADFETFSRARPISDLIGSYKRALAERLQRTLISAFSQEDVRALYRIVFWDLNFQLSRSIEDPIRQEIDARALGMDSCDRGFCTYEDADWLWFYDILVKSRCLKVQYPSPLHQFTSSGGFELLAFSDFAIAVPTPKQLHRNESFALHHEDGAAIQWESGFCFHFWHGISVPSKLIEKPNTVTREDILSEANVEVRRCYQEALGSTRFAELLDLFEIDRSTDRYGYDQVLLRTASTDKLAGGYIYFVNVACPSTGRKYMLCVPPVFKRANEAVAWTFGKSAADYKPIIET